MKKRAIGSLVLVSAMAMGSTGAFAADATKNADGKYDPEITITIGKQLDENTGRYGDGEDINKNPMTEQQERALVSIWRQLFLVVMLQTMRQSFVWL